jgi:hypothetical protein
VRAIFAIGAQNGLDRNELFGMVQNTTGHAVAEMEHLNKGEASKVIETLKAG